MGEGIDDAGHDVVTVVGIGEDGWEGLGAGARAALARARLIVGSARQLGLLPAGLEARREPLPSPLLEHLDQLVLRPGLCLLASGDPMRHGIGATLARRLGPGRLRVFPGVSSVALACARLGWPEPETEVVSLVTQPPEAALAALRPGGRVVLLCRDGQTPHQVAQLLAASGWGDSEVTVLERLGGPAERVLGPVQASGLAGTGFADLCVLGIRPRADAGTPAGRMPGLPDAAFESDGQLTRRELRVLALAALRPGPGELLWDVGAGSGSIGIEWLRAEPLARAVAVEARADRAERVQRNAAALGVPGLQVITGPAPAALAGLPPPDAVFVGGGLTADGLLEACWERLRPGGRLVAHAVTVESEAVLHRWQRAEGGQLVRADLSYAEPLGGFTTWRPALPVIQWQVTRP
ncbi:MAG TPA: precorrin-6y C5,15-methyltransferase (decarboxylating) subunit CbiE [Streptosporangiaceae bacterium]|jgi:precorrin-6Y C5,15-methyltransferase (decarboxylating)|nr:precorrin-6y C5,15-methyltransferase (decarboxylating) subunit CbiE [Streptosporangiaceae bacterium]